VHKAGASLLVDGDVEQIPPSGRDVLLVLRVHDKQTQQIAVRLEPREIDVLVEALGGRIAAGRTDDPKSCV
jgi:hypothetical protein